MKIKQVLEIKKFRELIAQNTRGMFINRGANTELSGRPMTTNYIEPDCTMWLTINDTLATLVQEREEVFMSYANVHNNSFVVVKGMVLAIEDTRLINEYPNLPLLSDFSITTSSESTVLVKVKPVTIDYWIGGAAKISITFTKEKISPADRSGDNILYKN